MTLPITAAEALDSLRAELLAMPAPPASPTKLDVGSTAMMVLSLVDSLTPYRDAVLELMGERAARPFDRLELVALATLGADLEVVAIDPTSTLAPAAELHRLRQLMRTELALLAQRGLIDERAGRAITGKRGHRHLCLDVLLLTTLFETHRSVTEAHTSLTRRQLASAESLANELIASLGPQPRSAAEDLRARALDLLVQTYGEVQRALDFLRWHQRDAHLIAPSLWKRPGAGRRPAGGRGRRRAGPISEPTPIEPTQREEDVVDDLSADVARTNVERHHRPLSSLTTAR